MAKVTSNASWTKVGNSHDTHDIHNTDKENIAYAHAICDKLMSTWGPTSRPCEIRGTCKEVWVEVDGKRVEKKEY